MKESEIAAIAGLLLLMFPQVAAKETRLMWAAEFKDADYGDV